MFMGNLQGPYLERIVGSTSLGFSDLVLVIKRIKNMIKMDKIQNVASTSGMVKKPYAAYGKKRKGEVNEILVVRGRALEYRVPYDNLLLWH